MRDILLEFLKASLDEQLPVTVYFDNFCLRGVVGAINGSVVELRHESGRTAILVEHVVAVTRE